jgi:D-arginine dehydrogenase
MITLERTRATQVADFLVVGAGIAGASVAAELSTAYSVVLIEAESQPGYHSTGRSAALFSEIYGNRVIRNLSRASRHRMLESSPPFAEGPFTGPRGSLFIATTEQLDLLRSFAAQDDVRAATRHLDMGAALALCPVLRPDYVAAALYEPGARDIDVHRLHQAYLRRFREQGGRLLTSCRLDAIERTAGVWEIRSEMQTLAAPILINAAGAWADQIAMLASVAPAGLRPLRRSALLVDGPEGSSFRTWPAVIAADESFYFKPDANRLLLSPADETLTAPCDAQPEEWDVAVAIDRVTAAANIPVPRILHRWAGLRTFARDRIPVVGFDPAGPGFFWLAGHGGYGVQTAPALAIVAAALASGRSIPEAIADFDVVAEELSPRRLLAVPT